MLKACKLHFAGASVNPRCLRLLVMPALAGATSSNPAEQIRGCNSSQQCLEWLPYAEPNRDKPARTPIAHSQQERQQLKVHAASSQLMTWYSSSLAGYTRGMKATGAQLS